MGAVIVELKSGRRVVSAHETQFVNYLVATGKPVDLALNFGERKVEVKRKLKDLSDGCLSCYPVPQMTRFAILFTAGGPAGKFQPDCKRPETGESNRRER